MKNVEKKIKDQTDILSNAYITLSGKKIKNKASTTHKHNAFKANQNVSFEVTIPLQVILPNTRTVKKPRPSLSRADRDSHTKLSEHLKHVNNKRYNCYREPGLAHQQHANNCTRF